MCCCSRVNGRGVTLLQPASMLPYDRQTDRQTAADAYIFGAVPLVSSPLLLLLLLLLLLNLPPICCLIAYLLASLQACAASSVCLLSMHLQVLQPASASYPNNATNAKVIICLLYAASYWYLDSSPPAYLPSCLSAVCMREHVRVHVHVFAWVSGMHVCVRV